MNFLMNEVVVMAGLSAMTLAFAAIYSAAERFVPFLRGGLGRM